MLRALALAARGRGRGLRRGDFSGGKGVPKGDVNTVKRSVVMDSRPLFAPEQFGDNACAPFTAQPAAAQRRMAQLPDGAGQTELLGHVPQLETLRKDLQSRVFGNNVA